MKRSIRTLEQLQLRLTSDAATTGGGSSRTGTTVEQRRAAEAAKQKRLATLTPYKQAEYRCVECVAELRQALRDVEEFEVALGRRTSAGVGRSREEEEAGDAVDADDDESTRLLRRQEGRQGPSSSTETALLEQELARSRQQARRAHQRLQQLQREAARLASRAAAKAPAVTSSAAVAPVADASAPSAALEALEWQRALPHVERAKQWYRDVFGIRVVSSLDDPVLQLNRPAQPQQSAGSMAHFGRGANPVPSCVTAAAACSFSSSAQARGSESAAGWVSPQEGSEARAGGAGASTVSPLLMLQSAREDAEFREFFASVQANDELIDAAMDRISDGVHRLLENARGMQDELAVQEALLQQAEVSAEAAEAQLTQMNRRLRRAIREMEDSSICMYVVCLLVLLLVLGLLLRVAS
ncbi:Qb-SNARE protein [Leishmania donovani]|uniref:Uncharacterized protein n=3 Tax=Leishmania donovani species complex TaxID=38574 RepID=A4HSX4_LEIIN|nr:conserved hypothetical protein [Leishmania infantum JPCM5]TPP49750.1 hypothetical protein CGC20_19960 [Leishmania donovani]CAC9446419.1 Qb-SNARE_protein_-_putative [Leishmania infantum]CAJ1986182.1 Qb-SNARE protein [Leishmania donovani]CAM65516.1 conserved hypothetical protein [Leishmania infantum JPCM5]SUZ39130.1 Qb-SNARE_protein_-_putative [Leishmania infantum]|eukprot:XP_001463165.1 conserved hypothetical protein [Leishmania infantum JPCM5]